MRVSIKDLQTRVNQLNKETGVINETYTKGKDGKYTANIGVFHLSQAYGGVALHRIMNENGGVTDIFGYHMPKRELMDRISGYFTLQYEINHK
jgi:hypothetical protein